MTDIPEDIMREARKLTEDYRERYNDVRASTNITDVWGIEDRMHTEAIARAILAERERGAQIAERHGLMTAIRFVADPREKYAHESVVSAVSAIASAIRNERAGE